MENNKQELGHKAAEEAGETAFKKRDAPQLLVPQETHFMSDATSKLDAPEDHGMHRTSEALVPPNIPSPSSPLNDGTKRKLASTPSESDPASSKRTCLTPSSQNEKEDVETPDHLQEAQQDEQEEEDDLSSDDEADSASSPSKAPKAFLPKNFDTTQPRHFVQSVSDWLGLIPPSEEARIAALAEDMAPPSTSGSSSSKTPSVQKSDYRDHNLAFNKIKIGTMHSPLPSYISSHVRHIVHANRDSSPSHPSSLMSEFAYEFGEMQDCCTEAEVDKFLDKTVFFDSADPRFGNLAGLNCALQQNMKNHLLPKIHSQKSVSVPRPDRLFGYSIVQEGAPDDLAKLCEDTSDMLHPTIGFFETATNRLVYPFLVVEQKATAQTDGRHWVATNQCAGGMTVCLSIIHQLNKAVRATCSTSRGKSTDSSLYRVGVIAYGIAVDQKDATVYVGFIEGEAAEVPQYIIQQVAEFRLSRTDEFTGFRCCVRNLLEWGNIGRRKAIREALRLLSASKQRN